MGHVISFSGEFKTVGRRPRAIQDQTARDPARGFQREQCARFDSQWLSLNPDKEPFQQMVDGKTNEVIGYSGTLAETIASLTHS